MVRGQLGRNCCYTIIMGYSWDFSALRGYETAFLLGALLTLALGVLSSAIGTILGIPIAIALRIHPVIAIPVGLVMDALRAIPNLVLILAVYYLPYQSLIGRTGPSPFAASLIGLIIAQMAYSADLIRSAIDAVPEAQLLAVRGLGFREWQVARWVTWPSVVRQVLPSHMALWIGNVKLSSLSLRRPRGNVADVQIARSMVGCGRSLCCVGYTDDIVAAAD